MIVSSRLLADLKRQLKLLEADLKRQSDEGLVGWARSLRAEFDEATARGRTAFTWSAWREGELTQAAVAWIIASTFLRFSEDNGLLNGVRDNFGRLLAQPWIAGPGEKLGRAVENQTAYYSENPTANVRDWLQQAFGVLADLPAGSGLVDRRHNPVWRELISADAAKVLVDFWRATERDGTLAHDFTDAEMDTRFLGDLYQDLSEYAKKTFALLQTPEFVEEFILDRTLTPAINEFGIEGLKLIDPTCGSGHFLLGAFERLDAEWRSLAPTLDARSRVQKALNSIYGVDLNPFAVAISRFRLTVAALNASGEASFVGAPAFGYHLAVGDSLLQSQAPVVQLDVDDNEGAFSYAAEDVGEYFGILDPGQYHVVVGNPPYITVKDRALNEAYRREYPMCAGKYALSVPFMELFFRLAKRERDGSGSGYVGKITSNSFMKREFGKKLIEQFLSGADSARNNPVDLTHVVDTSGAYIPGHGTPTVVLFGRRRRPVGPTVRAALGVRGEPGKPVRAAEGLVWTEIERHLNEPGFDGEYITIADLPRESLAHFPWSLSGGGAAELMAQLEARSAQRLRSKNLDIGMTDLTGEDDAFTVPTYVSRRLEWAADSPAIVDGEDVRDYMVGSSNNSLLPVTLTGEPLDPSAELRVWFWRVRALLRARLYFGQTPVQRGLRWFDHAMFFARRHSTPFFITFAFVATHNHFALHRGGKVFNRTAPVIKLPADALEDDYLELLGILNSSTACFWLKQVSHNKGDSTDTNGARVTGDPAFDTYEFTGTKLQEFPLPEHLPLAIGTIIDSLAQSLRESSPIAVVADLLDLVDTKDSVRATQLLAEYRSRDLSISARMVYWQEELDWEVYRLYGLIEDDLTHSRAAPIEIALGERAFEIVLARSLSSGTVHSRWFERGDAKPLTEIPGSWPRTYRDLVQRRLDIIATNPLIRLLERPENKRRWATVPWESRLNDALRDAVLTCLDNPELWRDSHGPVTRSTAQLADALRNDKGIGAALELLAGSTNFDVTASLTALISADTVPFLGSLRYSHTGMAKFREWQQIWELQRAEDAGDIVAIPLPPKYGPSDFAKTPYWRVRGKLDVPRERFISYPGASREGDSTPVLGWAGWDHAEQGLALSRLVGDQAALGANKDQMAPLLAGLMELEPWLDQWHAEVDPTRGTSPAAAITGLLEQQLTRLGMTRVQASEWRPTASTRVRRKLTSASGAEEKQE